MKPPFYLVQVGNNCNKWTLLVREQRTFYVVDGAQCVIEGGQHDLLKSMLQSGTIAQVASRIGTNERRVEKLRLLLGAKMKLGGDRRSAEFQKSYVEPPDAGRRICVVGDAERAVIVVSATVTNWRRVPSTQILFDGTLSAAITHWLMQTNNYAASESIGLGYNKVRPIRILLNAPVPSRKQGKIFALTKSL